VIEGRTADNPDNLYGEGIMAGVIDEASRVKELSWHAIRTTLTQTQGELRIVGNPKGKKNWFFRMCMNAKDPLADKTQLSYTHLKSTDNPYNSEKEVELAKSLLPKHVFDELYLGIAQDDIAGVFTHIKECISPTLSEPESNVHYYMGLDLAKHKDYTVLFVCDKNKRVRYFERYNTLDWVFQKQKIEAIAKKYNGAKILMDSTGIGDPIFDDLRDRGLNIEGLKFTNESKKHLIEGLAIAIQNRDIAYPDIPELIDELELFEYQITPAGNITYSAPEGYHDDCVISLALMNQAVDTQTDITRQDVREVEIEEMESVSITESF
jgi:phage FluMu gp28-like protein